MSTAIPVRFWGTRGSLPAPLGHDAVRLKIREALLAGAASSGALPYEFVSAARAVPSMESVLSEALAASTLAMVQVTNIPALFCRAP